MKVKMHKITIPTIVEVGEGGAQRVTPRVNVTGAEECLLVIYPHPTVRQARIQCWLSLKMLAGAVVRAAATYLRRINLAHNAICRFYRNLPEQESRSFDHGR